MVDFIVKEVKDSGKKTLGISHCNCPERAEHVRQLARERCQFGEILLAATGGIATVYANDGGVIAAY